MGLDSRAELLGRNSGAGQQGAAGYGAIAAAVGHTKTPGELESGSLAKRQPRRDRLPYLDGLRGVLCVVVVVHHCLCAFWPCLIFGQSANWLIDLDDCPGHSHALLWIASHLAPAYNGKFAVVAFYVLSGLVLSHQFLQDPKAGAEQPQPQRAWALAVAKRYFRLALPCAGASLFAYALAGITSNSDAAAVTGSRWLAMYGGQRPLLLGLLQQMVWGTVFVGSTLNNAMWTMRMEFFGSLLVFLLAAVIVRSGNTDKVRCRVLVVAILFCLASSGTLQTSMQANINWDGGNASVPLSAPFWREFLHNRTVTFHTYEPPRHETRELLRRPPMLIDEVPDTPMLSRNLSQLAKRGLDITVESDTGWSRTAPLMWYMPFIIGVGLACAPQLHWQIPWPPGIWCACICIALVCAAYPFCFAAKLVGGSLVFKAMAYISNLLMLGDSGDVFWYTVGAAALVHAVVVSPLCQQALMLRPVAWLGKVSFGLYLTHIPILYTFTCYIFLRSLAFGAGYGGASLLACSLSLIIMLFVADLFTQYVDQPAIRLSGHIGRWLLGED